MAERTIFKNAPITEAVLDVRVRVQSQTGLEALSTLSEQDSVKEKFPKKSERASWRGDIRFTAGERPEIRSAGETNGYLFSTSDGRELFQARLDGFTFNKLRPYDRWEPFRDEARQLWTLYAQIARPVEVTRLGLRYINRIEIPLPMRDFKDYILTVPEVAPKLPQVLRTFFMQLQIPLDDVPATAIVTQALHPINSQPASAVPLIFDIDVFQEAAFESSSEDIWKTFEKLHDSKNMIFFGSITEKARELFK